MNTPHELSEQSAERRKCRAQSAESAERRAQKVQSAESADSADSAGCAGVQAAHLSPQLQLLGTQHRQLALLRVLNLVRDTLHHRRLRIH